MNINQRTRALPEILKLNLGAGKSPIDGYENIDRKTGQEVYPLNYPDGCADEIRASHVLEHFSHTQIDDVFREWVRVLKPGGIIKIAVPDFDLICQWHATGQISNAHAYLMGGHIDDDDCHGAAITRERLSGMFMDAGLEDVRDWPADVQDCSSLDISLNMQARKPLLSESVFNGVYGIFPSARYGPALTHKCLYDALRKLNMTIRMTAGCFWNQHLCPAMEESAANADCRYILTFDFDSVFTADDVLMLYRILETHPEIDALSPFQSHRGLNTPLFTVEGTDRIPSEYLGRIAFPAATTHFGLTMIRAEKLRQLPHPWMKGEPGPDGRWSAQRIDPDIWFWQQWKKSGFSIYVSPRVSIGHIDELILWVSRKDLTPIYQKSSDYVRYGKPPEAL